ncbi:tetratricopeptide repeat protein [Marinomonas algicola]|uniref:tetratricopeptide repeat protein n=1 Tax=Marinomonas algicola TaxID=2773454 RepID=UPI00174DDB57|nr:AMIN domain-containing protein [Marinomonas algicola]
MYNKTLLSLLFILFLSGCVPQNTNTNESAGEKEKNEFLMIQANNYNGLIELYSSLLKQDTIESNEKNSLRYKLANVYFNAGDSEAALFQLDQLSETSINTKERYLLQARSQYKEAKYEAAQVSLGKAFKLDEKYSDAYNFQGILFTEQGMLYDARKSFSIARQNSFDDASVRNNLAMLDILEGDFNSALKILLPILQSGQADDMIKANMVLIYAKLNKFSEFRAMLGKKMSDEEAFERFQLMHNLEIQKTPSSDVGIVKNVNPVKFFKNRDGVLIVPSNDPSKFYDKIKESEVSSGVVSTDSLEYMLNNNLLFPDVVVDQEVNGNLIDSLLRNEFEHGESVKFSENGFASDELKKTQILGITYDFKNNTHRFSIAFSDKALSYSSFDLLAGDQWVVDVQGAFKEPNRNIYKFNNEFVEQSAISVYPDFARIIYKLKNGTSIAPVLTTKNNILIVEWKSV